MSSADNTEKFLEAILPHLVFDQKTPAEFQELVIARLLNQAQTRIYSIEKTIAKIQKLVAFAKIINRPINDLWNVFVQFPTYIVSDWDKNFFRFLILGKVVATNQEVSFRDIVMIKRPKDLFVSPEILYSRICFFENELEALMQANKKIKSKKITHWRIIGASEADFSSNYHKTEAELFNRYPFDEEAKAKVINWPENENIIQNIDLDIAKTVLSQDLLKMIAVAQRKGKNNG